MFDVLVTQSTPPNGRRLLHALHHSAPCQSRIVGGRPSAGSVLMLYGMGGPDRYQMAIDHVANGGTVVAWDIGYWFRKGPRELRHLRVSINGMHSPQFMLCGPVPPATRWEASNLQCAKRGGNSQGPVILVGNGPKSNAVGARGWAAAKSMEIRKAMPGAQIIYRPKPKRPHDMGVDCDQIDDISPIDMLLSRASLVVCRHSNVAVDACRIGVPVVCEDGAAAAIYPASLEDRSRQPSHKLRQEFLQRLAWWQWSTMEAECGVVWPWLLGILDEIQQPLPA